ncbi:MAG TPA: hypothetical protein VNG51_16865 [Ktedonobacteraceae bacterium]|nr:hypothetical protein [Ktedonobacteraceae bacterium]
MFHFKPVLMKLYPGAYSADYVILELERYAEEFELRSEQYPELADEVAFVRKHIGIVSNLLRSNLDTVTHRMDYDIVHTANGILLPVLDMCEALCDRCNRVEFDAGWNFTYLMKAKEYGFSEGA